MDHNVGLETAEHFGEVVAVCNICLNILDAVGCGPPVALASNIDHGHGGRRPVPKQEVYHVVAEEAAAANDKDMAQGRLLEFLASHDDVVGRGRPQLACN